MFRLMWVGVLVSLVVCGSVSAWGSEHQRPETNQAYEMSLQVRGGMSSCRDVWGAPEYYAAASRSDPEIEEELEGIRIELSRLNPRVEVFDDRIEPLVEREHNTVPLSDDELRELEESRRKELVLAKKLSESGQDRPSEEHRTLKREHDEAGRSVRRLENSIPLTEEEARFLIKQREQLAPLVARRGVLSVRQGELRPLISMRTPDSLRVYLNDSLELELMEEDWGADDTCATWRLRLDEEIIQEGGKDLKRGDRTLLRLWIRPVN